MGRPALSFAPPPLLLVGGKGGVGKTTLSAALGLELARRAPRAGVLILTTDPARALAPLVAAGNGKVPGNVAIEHVDAAARFRRFLSAHRSVLTRALTRNTLFDASDAAALLALRFPGLDEVAALLVLSEDRIRGFAHVVVDTAPTGHALRLLDSPGFMRRFLSALDALGEGTRQMAASFGGDAADPALERFLATFEERLGALAERLTASDETGFLLVARPERRVVEETRRYRRELEARGIALLGVVANRVGQGRCAACRERRARQGPALGELKAIAGGEAPFWRTVPEYPRGPAGVRELSALGRALGRGRGWPRAGALTAAVAAAPRACISPPLPVPAARRLLIVAGKGGVGKTSIASAAALAMARGGARVLLLSIDPSRALGSAWKRRIGASPTTVASGLPQLSVAGLDAEADFASFKEAARSEIASFFSGLSARARLPYEQRALEELLEMAPPGIDEVMALAAVVDHLGDESLALVLDAPPTGHFLRFLETPDLARDWLRMLASLARKYKAVGALRALGESLVAALSQLRRLREIFAEPGAAQALVVAHAEPLALAEARTLARALARAGIPGARLFVNRLTVSSACVACRSRAAAEGHELAGAGRAIAGAAGAPELGEEVAGSAALGRLWRACGTLALEDAA